MDLINMKLILTTILTLLTSVLVAQITKAGDEHFPLKFIDKVEIFAGPSQSFNYGNKFVENYKDENVTNKRLLKPGYAFGVGVYHPISERFDLNARFQIEQRGTNAELNIPTLKINSEYTYKYLTFNLLPQIHFGRNKKFYVAVGGYYSALKDVSAIEEVYDKTDKVTRIGNFEGRSVRYLRDDGTTQTIAFSPGLQSFAKFDYGLVLGIGYSVKVRNKSSIVFQCVDNLGLQNINKSSVGILDNPPENNHTISFAVGYIHKRPFKKIKT